MVYWGVRSIAAALLLPPICNHRAAVVAISPLPHSAESAEVFGCVGTHGLNEPGRLVAIACVVMRVIVRIVPYTARRIEHDGIVRSGTVKRGVSTSEQALRSHGEATSGDGAPHAVTIGIVRVTEKGGELHNLKLKATPLKFITRHFSAIGGLFFVEGVEIDSVIF